MGKAPDCTCNGRCRCECTCKRDEPTIYHQFILDEEPELTPYGTERTKAKHKTRKGKGIVGQAINKHSK